MMCHETAPRYLANSSHSTGCTKRNGTYVIIAVNWFMARRAKLEAAT
jgi:hypothetical protein